MRQEPLSADSALPNRRLDLFPLTTRVAATPGRTVLSIGGCDVGELAQRFGTPLYLFDQTTLDQSVRAYQTALSSAYPGPSGITYAGKAGMTLALAQWAASRGLRLDCTGVGELHVALVAGVPRAQILVHGVNKSAADLALAWRTAGVIVVDNLDELQRLIRLAGDASDGDASDGAWSPPELWLRVRPGTAVETHAYRQTGQVDSKFGMDRDEVVRAVELAQQAGLRLTGLHFHQGSHFHDPEPVAEGVETVVELMAFLHRAQGWTPDHLSPGGGWGIAYHEDELPQPLVAHYVDAIAATLVDGCAARDLPLPALHVEPGRSLVARAGVALYTVGAVKVTPNRRWLLIDGGMADNIRPALYGARYSALPVIDPLRPPTVATWLGGPYCESGDVLLENLPLPELTQGEVVAIPASGAYHISMSSNYNGACRPAVVWLHDGAAALIRRREVPDDLLRNDLPLPGAATAAG